MSVQLKFVVPARIRITAVTGNVYVCLVESIEYTGNSIIFMEPGFHEARSRAGDGLAQRCKLLSGYPSCVTFLQEHLTDITILEDATAYRQRCLKLVQSPADIPL